MVLRKTGSNEIWLDSYLSYILMRTIGPLLLYLDFGKILGVYIFLYFFTGDFVFRV